MLCTTTCVADQGLRLAGLRAWTAWGGGNVHRGAFQCVAFPVATCTTPTILSVAARRLSIHNRVDSADQ